jgi:serine/threonine protein kinase
MAEIYLARAPGIQGFEKYVVLKQILPQFAANPQFVRMFLREARLAAVLDHANIAHVYDIGEEDGNFFFTMEYLHGEDVRHIMKELNKRSQRLPLEHALAIAIDVAAGLHFAHEKRSNEGRVLGIVHCDVSPSNIVVTYDGGVKVVDFGVAKITADPEVSRNQSLKGKLAYMSPEQVGGKRLDRRSDLFSLGIVLYEMSTSTRLFQGPSDAEVMRAVQETSIRPPSAFVPGYPRALEGIVMRALSRDPAERYQRGRDLQIDLESFARDHKLQLSSAALADWMEQTFGPKPELWHTLPPNTPGNTATRVVPARGSGTPSPVDELGATRVVPTNPAEPPSTDDGQMASTTATSATVAEESSRPGSRPLHRRRLGIAAAAGGLLALLLGLSLRHRSSADAASTKLAAPSAPAVVLVAEGGKVAVESSSGTSPDVRPLTDPAPAPAANAARPAVGRPRAPRRAREPGVSAAPVVSNDFSAILARRENDIRRCFSKASDPGAIDREISLRFELGREGRVTGLTVLPPSVASTPLGACLDQVGRSTAFPRQPQPVAFRIPVTVRTHRERGRDTERSAH